MRKDTNKMLSLLRDGAIKDFPAARKLDNSNPRREAAILRSKGYDVRIKHLTDKNRKYSLVK